MAIYDVKCAAGHEHEVFAKWRDVTPCPTCGSPTHRIWKGARAVIGDDWPGGKTFEHITDQPITVHSKSELKRVLDAHGLRHKDTYHPNDGSDWTKLTDPQTLKNGAELILRAQGQTADPGTLETFKGSINDVFLGKRE